MDSVVKQQAESSGSLLVPDPSAIKAEVQVVAPVDQNLAVMADKFVQQVMSYDPNDAAKIEVRNQAVASVDAFGARIQEESAKRSMMLQRPIRDLGARGNDGGPVAEALINLSTELDQLDPGKFDFEGGWVTRTLGMLPGVGSPLQKYFMRFESAETIISNIIRSLKEGKEQLKRDNIALLQDQSDMRNLTIKLQQSIKLGMMLDQKLSQAFETDLLQEDQRKQFIEEELLFPLRQRIGDLQQQLAVNQQGVIAVEVVMRNNKELIKGVNRALNVTVNALNVAVTVALALANQSIVLAKIDEVDKTTNNLLRYTASQLKTQGTAIHKQAASLALNMEDLKRAFSDIRDAMEEISTYRREALPVMAQTIVEMDRLTSEAEKSIQKLERGDRGEASISLDII